MTRPGCSTTARTTSVSFTWKATRPVRKRLPSSRTSITTTSPWPLFKTPNSPIWPVSACGGPYNETMAIDKKNGRLFVGCRPDYRRMLAPPGPRPNRVMAILDTRNGHVVATVPIGGNPDQADFDPGTGLAFSANGEGTVTVIKEESPDRFRVLETVQTEPGALRIAVDRKTHKIFVPNADPGIVPPATPENPNPPPGPPRNFRVLILGT